MPSPGESYYQADSRCSLGEQSGVQFGSRVQFLLIKGWSFPAELASLSQPQRVSSSCCPACLFAGYDNSMMREQKRVGSSSFSKPTHTPPSEKNGSFSADKLNALRTQERGAERLLVAKVVEGLGSSAGGEWRLNSFDEKRTIAGFKARIQWVWAAQDVRVTLKISFASSYFRLSNHLTDGDIFVEVEELSFALPPHEKRALQERLERLLANSVEVVRGRAYSDEAKKQGECLRKFLQDAGAELQGRNYEGLRRGQERIERRLSKKYMLYPSPASFAWNPLGTICITENKYPLHRKTFIGEPNSLRKYFESSRHDAGFNLREEGSLDLGEGSHEAIYDWRVEQDVELLIFSREKSFKQERYYSSRAKNEGMGVAKREEKQAEGQGVLLANLNPLANNKLRRIYERHFGGPDRGSQFHRHDKLRVYDVRSFNRDHEDDIVFLFQRLTNGLQGLFQNELSAYPGLLQDMRPLHYKLLGGMLQQALNNPRLRFYSFLKLFVLQNQFLSEELERYFKQLYRLLGRIPHHQLYSLGSYNHFDTPKAELLLFDLLQLTIDPPERPPMTKPLGDGVVVRVRSRVGLPRFSLQSLVSEGEKNGFLTGLFPILIVKDREMEKFEFKQLKRIITANAKLFQFLKRMNELVGKAEEGRNRDGKTPFLRALIDSYRRYSSHHEHSHQVIQSRRLFYLHCRHCQHPNRLYDLSAREDLEFCGKCKQKLVAETA